MTNYRAAYIAHENSAGTVLTTPEQATLTDAELIKEALAEAERAGIKVREDQIIIGDWIER